MRYGQHPGWAPPRRVDAEAVRERLLREAQEFILRRRVVGKRILGTIPK